MRATASEESNWRNLSRPSRFRCVEPTRRDVTCGGAVAAFSLLLTELLGTASPVKADALAGPIPTLDRVAVRIVIEDYQFAVAPGHKEDGLVVENFGWGIGPDHPPGRTLVSEFGLSMHVESHRGDETRQVLMDFGFTPEALNNNLSLIGVKLGQPRRACVEPWAL
jgi:7,8-dihydropterin-6-yl-methyl-4-(beta-D-ribofuranosyl)aminobenzene 5'-phosphate synthase